MAYDAIVVGAGPAGVSCGIWLQQLGFSTALVDRNRTCGGLQLSNPWTNTWIPSSGVSTGAEVARALHESALHHGCELFMECTALSATRTQKGWCVALDSGLDLTSRCLVLAGGVVPKAAGLVSRASILVGPGPAIASTSFQDSQVAILGGGDSAFENYQIVMQKGARLAHIFARTLRARAEMLERVPPEHVHVGTFDFDERSRTVNGRAYDHVLALFGYEANRQSLLGLEPAMQPSGFVQTDQNCRTSIEDVWAIGELAQRAHPCCVTAMADGVIAAKDIQRTLEGSRTTRYLNSVRRGVGMLGNLRAAAL